jgi:hypothetical protein
MRDYHVDDLHPDPEQPFPTKAELNGLSLFVVLALLLPLVGLWLYRILVDDTEPSTTSGAGQQKKRHGASLVETAICLLISVLLFAFTVWAAMLIMQRNVVCHLSKEAVRYASVRPNITAAEVINFINSNALILDTSRLAIGVKIVKPDTIGENDAFPQNGVVHVDLSYDAGSGITLRSSAESMIPFQWTTTAMPPPPPRWP